MKHLIKLSIILVVLSLSNSCNYLDYDETTYFLKEDVFSDFSRSKDFLTNIYTYLPTGFRAVDGAMRASATDDAEHVWDNSNIQKFNNANWGPTQPLDNVYGEMYEGIRAVNLFLQETEGQVFEEEQWNDDYEEKIYLFDLFTYEARFLRAYFYFELIKRYKNVPLVTTVLEPEEANQVSQAPFDILVEFITEECNDVAKVLPDNYLDIVGGETGRATRGAALALKSRVLLYAASPLHNPSGEIEKWVKAADASRELIDSSSFSLEDDYLDVVNNHESVELILGVSEAASNYFEKNNFPIGFEGGNTGTCPTQNLVDSYEMSNTGLPIDDPSSGYDPNFPFEKRDPRLAATILVNGDEFKGKTIETWYGGNNAAPKAHATKTGYYLRKYLIESINLSPNNTSSKKHTWVLFRYAEILLNYAEAMNEAYGPEDAAGSNLSALDAVNMIRERVEMPPFEPGLSQEAFRQKLRNERRVELAFEDHRFWDIRRWKIGETTRDIYGVLIVENPYGGWAYEKKMVESRIFEEHMNLYPIPQSEIFINGNILQNEGW